MQNTNSRHSCKESVVIQEKMTDSRNSSSDHGRPAKTGTSKINANSVQAYEPMFLLLDGASSQKPIIAPGLDTRSQVTAVKSRLLRDKEGLSVLPASAAGLTVLLERHRKEPLPGDRYVVILTGRKS